MTSDTYLMQRKRLRDFGTRLIQAAEIGDFTAAQSHINNAQEIITEVNAAWQKHRIGSLYPLGEEPSEDEAGGGGSGGAGAAAETSTEDTFTELASPATRIQVIRERNGLLGDNADLEI